MGPSKREAAISGSSDNSDSPKSRLGLGWKLIDLMVVNEWYVQPRGGQVPDKRIFTKNVQKEMDYKHVNEQRVLIPIQPFVMELRTWNLG